jgi:hypothetical protein
MHMSSECTQYSRIKNIRTVGIFEVRCDKFKFLLRRNNINTSAASAANSAATDTT